MRSNSGEDGSGGGTAGPLYAALIKEQLDSERHLKASLEQRGITVITTAGTLVTLLFAVGALVTRAQDYRPPAPALGLLFGALLLFLGAATAALFTSFVRRYEEVKIDALRRLVDERYWTGPGRVGEMRTAEVRIRILEVARRQNAVKATALKWALWLEVGAVALVAAAVSIILSSG